MKITDEEIIGGVLLIELYNQFINDEIDYNQSVSVALLIEKCTSILAPDFEFGRNAARVAVDGLADSKYVEYDEDSLSPQAKITTLGIRRARVLISEEDELPGFYHQRRQEKSDQESPQPSTASTSSPASADDWAPLKIDRSSQSYQEAVDALQSAYETIRQDNGFASSEPETRDAIVDSLERGIDQLKNKNPTTSSIRALLLKPLAFVAERFTGAILGEAAKAAWRKLGEWLASSFGGNWLS